MFPDANIANKRIDDYPIIVTIEVEIPDEDEMITVWSGSQKKLFTKYGHQAVPEIQAALGQLKARLEK